MHFQGLCISKESGVVLFACLLACLLDYFSKIWNYIGKHLELFC